MPAVIAPSRRVVIRTSRTREPTVSVVIPTLGNPRLRRTLKTVLSQEGVDLEVLVVQDGPAAARGVDEIVRRAGDDRVRVLPLVTRRGMTVARNVGIAAARARWVAFLDDDDLWSPHKLRSQLDAAGEAAGFVYSSVVNVDDRNRVIAAFPAPGPEALLDSLLRMNVIPAGASNVMVRRALLDQLGGFDEAFRLLADWEAWIRLATVAAAAADSDFVVAYVHHRGNASLTRLAEHRAEMRRLVEKHENRARDRGVEVDEGWFARLLAGAQSRAGRRPDAVRLYLEAAGKRASILDVGRAAQAAVGIRVRPPRRAPTISWLQSIGPAPSERIREPNTSGTDRGS
jgi:glycosyltransferase involved in cell wall biosynthesis